MTSLVFVLAVLALFALLFYCEGSGDPQFRLRPLGLFTWLISGNWPAKVGAGLVIIGVGALLRYAFANIDVPPESKLGAGAIAAAALGFAAAWLKNQPARRAIHLALAGTAFGIAYLTAYSAYGFFNYITDVNALALLALVAVAAGVFAVSSNAMSVAILAMVGAYIAPKFAIGTPGVLPVYGYYLAASILSLLMVTLRGWRPLIHLSFLFTLAGALFFGWSGKFYEPAYFDTMQPLLLALTLVHALMPLLECKHVGSARMKHFDSGYFLALPLVAAALMLKIAPDVHTQGALGLGALALIWVLAAAVLYGLRRNEAPRHALVGVLLAIAALFVFSRDLPWLLIGLGLSVLITAVAPKLGWSRGVQQLASGMALLFWALHVIGSIVLPTPAQPFLNEMFTHRIVASALMLLGAWVGARQSIAFAKVLGMTGVAWAVLAVVSELLRLHIDFVPQLVFGLLLVAIALSVVFGDRMAAHPVIGGLLVIALTAGGWWAMHDTTDAVIVTYLVLTPLALLAMTWSGRDTARTDGSDFAPSLAIGLLPFALLPWAIAAADVVDVASYFFEATIAMAGIALAGLAARLLLSGSPRWNERIQPLHVYCAAFALLWATLFHIERGVWPVVFELLALAYLVAYVTRRNREQAGIGFGVGAMMVLSVALILQANLLRAFGPEIEVMTAADINKMHLPAVASLMWAIFGAALAWWGTYTKSRSVWSAGSVLLVIAAVKLVLFDLGTLGQLGNILAFIGAGVVFLGVAWFAPIPPKAEAVPVGEADAWADTRVHAAAGDEPAPKVTTAASLASAVEPLSQESVAGQSSAPPAAEKATAAARPKKRTSASRYRAEPSGINGLWFLLLGLALAVSLIATGWVKHVQHKKAWERYRQQLAEAQRNAEAPPVQAPTAPVAPVVPRPVTAPAAPAVVVARQDAESAARLPRPDSPTTTDVSMPAIKLVDACTQFTDRLPADYALYAAGSYKGSNQGMAAGAARESGRFDVTVNVPGKNVVVALGAYEPSLWNVRATSGTRIVGVLVSGYHTQTLQDSPAGVPVLNVSYESKSPCGYFYLTRENASQAAAKISRILGRTALSYTLAMDGKIEIGATTAMSLPPQPDAGKTERHVDESGRVIYRQVFDGGK